MPWRQENGRWVNTPAAQAGHKPAQRPIGHAATLSGYSGMSGEFARQPLEFMKRHAMAPGGGATTGGVTTVEWAIDQSTIIPNGGSADDPQLLNPFFRMRNGVKQLTGQRINMSSAGLKFMVLHRAGVTYTEAGKEKTASGFNGTIIPILYDEPRSGGNVGLPIYWLPWAGLKITELNIPAVPSNLVDPPEEEYPRFFLTAGINGCSVFVRGDARSPTVFHAGLEDKIKSGDAEAFWRLQLARAQGGFDDAAISGAVHKDEYLQKNPSSREGLAAKAYMDWLQQGEAGGRPLEIKLTTGYGCVFGVRYGAFWTMYLQQIIGLQNIRFYKRSDLNKTADGKYKAPGNVEVTRTVTSAPGRFFGTKQSKVYASKQDVSLPLQVVEIYPNRHWSGSIATKVAFSKV